MFDDDQNGNESECAVCLADHDDAIHEATVRIHRWFCAQVTHHFEDDEFLGAELAS
jgi:hypothetical protein